MSNETETTATPATAAPALQVFVDPDQLKRDIAIDTTSLTEAMQQHAALMVDYAVKAVQARRQYESMKNKVEIVEAVLDSEHRAALKADNPKATEAQIRSAVVTDRRWRVVNDRMQAAQEQHRIAEISHSAFDQRRDMLLQIARDAAREHGGNLRPVMNAAASRQELLDQMAANRAKAA